MMPRRRLGMGIAAVLLLAGAGGVLWRLRAPGPAPQDGAGSGASRTAKKEVKSPRPKTAEERCADLKERLGGLARQDWDEALFGRYEEIVRAARALQAECPGTKVALTAQELIIEAYGRQAKFPERFDAFLRYVEMGEALYDRDMSAKILLLEGNRHFKKKDFLTAHRFYEEVLSRFPGGKVAAVARFQTGRCFEEMGDWQVALRKYQAIAGAPTDEHGMKLNAWKRVYEVHARRGKIVLALKTLQTIREAHAGEEAGRWAQLETGVYLWRQRRNAQALDVLRDLRKRYPDSPEARRAESYIQRIEESLTAPDKALRGS